ncbi:hypothetical protein [Sphingobium chlorophenolicum]|uniref:hypothetical protein n=1 Tax=Sphingobium chlorophenolicum TaxID=46429 RepID=UPI00117E523B|nr:hypothetical protein [Sphingobium chlorophenolicum]
MNDIDDMLRRKPMRNPLQGAVLGAADRPTGQLVPYGASRHSPETQLCRHMLLQHRQTDASVNISSAITTIKHLLLSHSGYNNNAVFDFIKYRRCADEIFCYHITEQFNWTSMLYLEILSCRDES